MPDATPPAEPDLLQRLRAAQAQLRQEATQLDAALAARATATDKLCAITADPGGHIEHIEFTAEAATASPSRLSEAVMATYRAAVTQASRAASAAAPPAMRTVLQPPEIGLADRTTPPRVDESQALRPPASRPQAAPHRIPGAAAFLANLARADEIGLDAVLASSPFAPVPRGPGRDEAMRDRIRHHAAAAREAEPLLRQVEGTGEGELVTVVVGATGVIHRVQFSRRASSASAAELAGAVLETLAEARAAARAEREQVLAEFGLTGLPRFAD